VPQIGSGTARSDAGTRAVSRHAARQQGPRCRATGSRRGAAMTLRPRTPWARPRAASAPVGPAPALRSVAKTAPERRFLRALSRIPASLFVRAPARAPAPPARKPPSPRPRESAGPAGAQASPPTHCHRAGGRRESCSCVSLGLRRTAGVLPYAEDEPKEKLAQMRGSRRPTATGQSGDFVPANRSSGSVNSTLNVVRLP
jgi:hypothetical protein